MNARQKAKKYKSELLRLRDELDPRKASKHLVAVEKPRVETVKLRRIYDFNYPLSNEYIIREIGREVGNYLVENDMLEIYFSIDATTRSRIVEAFVKVVRDGVMMIDGF